MFVGRCLATQNHGLPDDEYEKIKKKLLNFMKNEIYPNEKIFEEQSKDIERQGNEWYEPDILKELQVKAKDAGLWK